MSEFQPRPITTSLELLPFAISYSDGEGGLAGIGAALWHPDWRLPLAVYSEVPDFRGKWRMVSGSESFIRLWFSERWTSPCGIPSF